MPRFLKRPGWALVAITLLGAALRCVAIDRLPPGLYHDEAYNGLDALNVLRGETPLYFPANNGREPLFIYLCSLSVAVLGPSPGALRIVSALLGTLTIPATWWLGRTLCGNRVGLLAAVLVAASVWPLNLSRVALRAVASPLLIAVFLALLWRGLNERRALTMVWAGLAYGLLFYTYLAARFTPLALAACLAYLAIWHRERLWARGLAVFAATTLAVAAPLGVYLASHGEVFGRAAQVSVFNPAISGGDPWRTLGRQVARTLGGLFWQGDFIPRHNVPLRPVFDPLTAAAFAGGVAVAGIGWRRRPALAVALIWTAVMLLPTVLAEDAPHFLRASGVLPVLYLLPAVGLDTAWTALSSRGLTVAGAVAVAAVLTYGAVDGCRAYALHLQSEDAYYNFEAGATGLAADVNAFVGVGWQGKGLHVPRASSDARSARAYVAPRLWRDWASLRYLAAPAAGRGLVTDEPSSALLAGADEVALYVWPFEDNTAAYALLPGERLIIAEEGTLERGDLEAEARLLYARVRAAPLSAMPAGIEVGARWEQGIDLLRYEVVALGDGRLAVDLYWRAGQALGKDYTVFVHVLEDGILRAQHDGPAASGYYGTDCWRPGDVVRDRHVLEITEPAVGREYEIRVGLYWWETMEHLAPLSADGVPLQDTARALPR